MLSALRLLRWWVPCTPVAAAAAVALCCLVSPLILRGLDRLLGKLAAWGIRKTPKAFRWTIDYICVRPGILWANHVWSEITILNWTWWNPPNFGNEDGYILQIDRLTLRLELLSIYRALRRREAIKVDHLIIEGVRFKSERDRNAALNLWEALDLPDRDVNVNVLVSNAHEHGGLRAQDLVKPLPAVATEATRQAARTRGRRELTRSLTMAGKGKPLRSSVPAAAARDPDAKPSSPSGAAPGGQSGQRLYHEYPIGDPRRRPRWGVPVRFDIRQLTATQLELWIFDMLTVESHSSLLGTGGTKLDVSGLFVPREVLEAWDERARGEGQVGDGIHGIYLGELVWVLVAQILRENYWNSAFYKNATVAALHCVKDAARIVSARVFELAIEARHVCSSPQLPPRLGGLPAPSGCRVYVHLICGRALLYRGTRPCVFARLELHNPGPSGKFAVADSSESALRLWTKYPWWDQTFSFGPVRSAQSELRITCFHRSVVDATSCHGKLGEVVVQLGQLLVESRSIARDGTIVGWWPLSSALGGDSGGFIKLRLCLKGKELLRDAVQA